ncbi:hypothetical protein OROMI_013850 [Orobanche minor]
MADHDENKSVHVCCKTCGDRGLWRKLFLCGTCDKLEHRYCNNYQQPPHWRDFKCNNCNNNEGNARIETKAHVNYANDEWNHTEVATRTPYSNDKPIKKDNNPQEGGSSKKEEKKKKKKKKYKSLGDI